MIVGNVLVRDTVFFSCRWQCPREGTLDEAEDFISSGGDELIMVAPFEVA